jgi:hypothetical protein
MTTGIIMADNKLQMDAQQHSICKWDNTMTRKQAIKQNEEITKINYKIILWNACSHLPPPSSVPAVHDQICSRCFFQLGNLVTITMGTSSILIH